MICSHGYLVVIIYGVLLYNVDVDVDYNLINA